MNYHKQIDTENMCPNLLDNQYIDAASQLQQNQLALAKALQNISSLQQNLSFMINLNTKLKQQNQRLKTTLEKSTKTTNKIMIENDKKISEMKQQNIQVAQLLEQTKAQLLDISAQLKTCEDEIASKDNIIREQKKAYMDLQFKIMNTSVSYIGENSCLADNKQCLYIAELQKQNNSLQGSLRRCEQLLQKQKNKANKQQKQINQFKSWMGSILGLQKVIDGSQKILMNQIAQRVISV